MGKRGPAPKGEYVGQTSVLSTRVTPELRARLHAEVEKKTNSTISNEVERRLRNSFIEDDTINSAFGSRRSYALMRAISMILEYWHNPSDLKSDWTSDPLAYDQVCRKINSFLTDMRPKGEAGVLSDDDQALVDLTARSHPAGILYEIENADAAIPLKASKRQKVLSNIKADLGLMIERSAERSVSRKKQRLDEIDKSDPAVVIPKVGKRKSPR
ncbi:hypothetical protein [Methylobacterium cerastii]|uniref:hypothetical protein n=1 Tax=Methylobacterium cerastii TaxID=932741 RepID=UPI001EE39A1A|nr:hypothetical protein [Methylobacterium cerastii]